MELIWAERLIGNPGEAFRISGIENQRDFRGTGRHHSPLATWRIFWKFAARPGHFEEAEGCTRPMIDIWPEIVC